MKKKIIMFTYCWIILIPMVKGAIPGTFFWKPRLGIDLSLPTTELAEKILLPSLENIENGQAVVLEGYQAGMTFVGLASGLTSGEYYPHLNPLKSFYYTNAYRWALRYISLLPFWIGGSGGHYCDTHKVWKRRFYYMDEFLPEWLRTMFFFVGKESWDQELKDFKRFKKYAEPAFGKHFRYPSKLFRNFASEYTQESTEDMTISLSSLSKSPSSESYTDEDDKKKKKKNKIKNNP